MKYHFTAPGIEASFQKYPLAKKAYDRVNAEHGAVFFIIHGDEAGVEGEHMIQIIDETVDGTQQEKEALMIAAMYSSAPEALLEDTDNFNALYGAEGDAAKAVLEEMNASKKNQNIALPTNMARISTVMNMMMLDAMTSDALPINLSREQKQEMRNEEKLMLQNLKAPKLEKLYRSFSDKLLGAEKAPAAKRKNGPKP